jgi:hypothetical protein
MLIGLATAFSLLWSSSAGADEDGLHERERRDLEGRKQQAEGDEQDDEPRRPVTTPSPITRPEPATLLLMQWVPLLRPG